MSRRMKFAIVLNSKQSWIKPELNASTCEYNWKVLFKAKLVPHNNPDHLVEAAQNYCKRLNELLGKGKPGKENMWQVCAHFKCESKVRQVMDVRFHGRLLEELRGLCGETLELTYAGTSGTPGVEIPVVSREMSVRPYTTIAQLSDESGCLEFNHAIQAYCEDCIVYWKEIIVWYRMKWMATKEISFSVMDTYINVPNVGGSLEETRYQLDVLKTIMRHEASADISIHGDRDFKVAAHKCFLIAQSSVLKEMVRQCRFGRIKLKDVSGECIKALLEYVYTFQISQAVHCFKVAFELFLFATKYEIRPLQHQLAKMMVERRNSWFRTTQTLDLFRFSRKLGRTSTIDELMGKIGQVLKWMGKKRIMESAGYHLLVVGDLNAASELCAAMANAN